MAYRTPWTRGSDPGLRLHNDAPEARCDTEPRPNTTWGQNVVSEGARGVGGCLAELVQSDARWRRARWRMRDECASPDRATTRCDDAAKASESSMSAERGSRELRGVEPVLEIYWYGSPSVIKPGARL